jgi:hypothetical protein
MTQACRTQTLTGKQAVSNQRPVESMQVFEQKPGLFEGALFAGDLNMHKHLCCGKDGG